MTVETASNISQLNSSLPDFGDPKAEGDDHIRLIKYTLKYTFPNVAGVVSASHTELSYVAGVTSAIQTQLNAKAPIASPTFTGTVTIPSGASIADYAPLASPALTGTPTAPTATTGTATTQIATTAFVAATSFSAALPGQTGNAGKFVTTDGTNASFGSPLGPIYRISTNTAAVANATYIIESALTLTLPASMSDKDYVRVINMTGLPTSTLGRNGHLIMGLAQDMTLDFAYGSVMFNYFSATDNMVIA